MKKLYALYFASMMGLSSVNASLYCSSPYCSLTNQRVLITDGVSMEPSIHKGDVLYSEEYVPDKPLSVGDVVQAYNGEYDQVFLHRVVSIKQDGFFMKGDNNFWKDNYKYSYSDVRSVVCV